MIPFVRCKEFFHSEEKYKVTLSDGWYSVNARFDAPLQEYIRLGRIKIGQKLHICGAKVLPNLKDQTDSLD